MKERIKEPIQLTILMEDYCEIIFRIQINLINLRQSNIIKNYLHILTKRLLSSEDT